MLAVQCDEPTLGQLAEPGIKRQGPLLRVTVQLRGRFCQCLLDDIRRIYSGGQSKIELHRHKAA
jgi:hypothetical protein